jgi:hypothetical protein
MTSAPPNHSCTKPSKQPDSAALRRHPQVGGLSLGENRALRLGFSQRADVWESSCGGRRCQAETSIRAPRMSWAEISIVFFVSHLTGDFLIQTSWQANHKREGLGKDPVARRALLSHASTYTLAFVPALIWIGDQTGVAAALLVAAAIFVPHMVVDDGRLVRLYMKRVKRCPDPSDRLTLMVDQSTHLICLWAAALLAAVLS